LRLPVDEFIRRFLNHVLPARFHRLRFCGFLATSQREQRLTECRTLLGLPDPEKPYIADITPISLAKASTPRCARNAASAICIRSPTSCPSTTRRRSSWWSPLSVRRPKSTFCGRLLLAT